jgi:transcriptional regulator with XRE-family HTH domain
MSVFIDRVQALLEEKGLSQKWLADQSNLSPANISRYLSGIHTPNIEIIMPIASALSVSVDYLLGLTDVQSPRGKIDEIAFALLTTVSKASTRDKHIIACILKDYAEPPEMRLIDKAIL